MSLPILSRRFFIENPPNPNLWSMWKTKYSWSEKLVPLYEWSGIVYVGCLSLPKSTPADFKTVFVLCESDSLAKTWEVYNSIAQPRAQLPNTLPTTPAATPEKSPAQEAPMGMDVAVAAKVPDKDDFFGDIERTAIASASSLSTKEDTSFEQLSRHYNIKAEESATLENNEAPLEHSETPENLNAEAVAEIEENSDVQALHLGLDFEAKTTLAVINTAEKSPTPAKENLANSEVRSKPVSTEVLYKKPGALSSNKELSEASRIAIRVQSPGQAEDFIHELFKELSYHYSKSMILMKDKNALNPWKWDENFELHAKNPSPIQLASPSPFRIVDRTQKSYHGYVVVNDINEKFFEEWNQSHVPEHLTISPILADDEVIGMVLGIGNKDADNKTSLQLSEKIAATIGKQMQKQPALFKAA